MSFFDLCQNWLSSYTGKDRVVVLLGTAALLCLYGKQGTNPVFKVLCLEILLTLSFLFVPYLTLGKICRKEGCKACFIRCLDVL